MTSCFLAWCPTTRPHWLSATLHQEEAMPMMGRKLSPSGSLFLPGPLLPQRKRVSKPRDSPLPTYSLLFGENEALSLRAEPGEMAPPSKQCQGLEGGSTNMPVFLTTPNNFPAGMERPSKCRAHWHPKRKRVEEAAELPDPKKPRFPRPLDLGSQGVGGAGLAPGEFPQIGFGAM